MELGMELGMELETETALELNRPNSSGVRTT
jgi:hypothetical protein